MSNTIVMAPPLAGAVPLFKAGDTVECIDPRGYETGFFAGCGLVQGDLYEVESYDQCDPPSLDMVVVKGIRYSFFADRFQLHVEGATQATEDAEETIDPLVEQRRELKRMLGGM